MEPLANSSQRVVGAAFYRRDQLFSGIGRITTGGVFKFVICEVFRVKKNDYWVPRGSAAVFFKTDWRLRSDMTPIQNVVDSGFPNKMHNISICRQPLYM